MNAARLIQTLQEQGVRIAIAGDRLRLEGPARVITPEMKQEVAANKDAIVAAFATAAGSIARCRPSLPSYSSATLQRSARGGERQLADVQARFLAYGTQAAPDDLREAAKLEEDLRRAHQTLDALYRGEATVYRDGNGRCVVFPRGQPS